jgi:hypothetical protein
MTTSQTDRFWAKVNKTDGCWLWTAYVNRQNGYGMMQWDGKLRLAHRISYALAFGPVPEGKWVLHHCDTPACVNPAHLFLGTHLDNMTDKKAKKREARGSQHGLAKLTEDDVRRMRALYQPRKFPLRKLARMFGVSLGTVYPIILRKTWTHVV